MTKLYAERDPRKLEPHYSRHMLAMTAERLDGKSAIAEELAFRDQRIEALSRGIPPNCSRCPYCTTVRKDEELAAHITNHCPSNPLRTAINEAWKALGASPGEDDFGNVETLAQAVAAQRDATILLLEAAGCEDADNIHGPVERIKGLVAALLSTHREENGSGDCADCGESLEDALTDGLLCPKEKRA